MIRRIIGLSFVSALAAMSVFAGSTLADTDKTPRADQPSVVQRVALPQAKTSAAGRFRPDRIFKTLRSNSASVIGYWTGTRAC